MHFEYQLNSVTSKCQKRNHHVFLIDDIPVVADNVRFLDDYEISGHQTKIKKTIIRKNLAAIVNEISLPGLSSKFVKSWPMK